MEMGAANRDPRQVPNADRLDVVRAENRHLSFGLGIHYCVGAELGRIEGQVALSSLLARVPEPKLDPERLEWVDSLSVRGVKSLPLALA
jgi:cytochrome P450